MQKPVYVLGTGLSHDGSSCLLKDGKILIAIEKERLTRKKHDGGNDLLTVQYCLDAAGIRLSDISLVVQAANFEKESIAPDRYMGSRCFKDADFPIVSISHHLAHAYSAVATAPFRLCNVLIIDGAGSPYIQCDDLDGSIIPDGIEPTQGYFCEKDSFYDFDGGTLVPLYKDFAAIKLFQKSNLKLPTIEHSIGGLYSAASNYCFGNMDDAGKLMGLAPYGTDTGKPHIFKLESGRCFVDLENIAHIFNEPRRSYEHFKKSFQHYADIAWWVQQETTRAVQYIAASRRQMFATNKPLAFAGGVALNAVANASLLQKSVVKDLYMQPAAGDNGLAIGCAYYGWMKVLGNAKPREQKSVFLGKKYTEDEVLSAVARYCNDKEVHIHAAKLNNVVEEAAGALASGKIIGWFQGGAEYGPRALGHRSILADARVENVQLIINRDVKNREDFRPFAPSVPKEHAADYFVHAYESPYMILTDYLKGEWRDILKGIVHVDGSSRVQTVTQDWNNKYYDLLMQFGKNTGVYVLLNTSFNMRGMPIVETPLDAIKMFCNSALDELYIDSYKIIRKAECDTSLESKLSTIAS